MIQTDPANARWLADFKAMHHRAPRVLHIGNIANNAYNNAKLLVQAGLDGDVICYDYYHCMGCPEWEDADFSGALDDDFHPDWGSQDLRGFERPDWFVQGPQRTCIDYLLAKNRGDVAVQKRLWHQLSIANQTIMASKEPPGLKARYNAVVFWLLSRVRWVERISRSDPVNVFARFYGRRQKRLKLPQAILASTLTFVWAIAAAGVTVIASIGKMFGNGVGRAVEARIDDLVEAWPTEFPGRADVLSTDDFTAYRQYAMDAWSKLFAYYDVVLGYSTDGIWPLLAGKKYLAFEHGTIREIPYRDTSQGRTTAMTYRRAEHVFVTNFDCLPSAQRLAPGRFTLINHPYDEDHGLGIAGWEALRASLRARLESDLLCFFPTRHDWVAGTGYADKANDIFLHAFAQLRHAGLRIGAVCCAWGANVEQSKALLVAAGVEGFVQWERPMAMVQFERMARACDLVVDQFKLGAFGGIVFKAMAAGAPILTFLEEDRLLEQYPEMPPVINCATQLGIVEQLQSLAQAPGRLAELGELSRSWIKKYHGKSDTVNLQLDQFRRVAAPGETSAA